ncbi:hypothetical protein RVR_887 [Actinacidiphila reveromycinica]|uniref:SH3b domain-containing protein n=1 Tax=Actinacidiphila reveromycinica TaxID=659352 RepID=A0A7U3UNJ5_9ACTN|nr:hypothetical protein [Streptomyces sp. SN-593]BBA95858.1 hypothetical protein RVR_887 [Streptomyces sp. SN-593]
MYPAHARHRVTTGIAGLLIAGCGLLAATSAYAVAPRPARPAGTGTGASAPAPDHRGRQAPPSADRRPRADTDQQAPSSAGDQQTFAAAEPQGRVVSRLPLTVREKATSASGSLGSLRSGAVVALHCKAVGQSVDGNTLWYLLGDGRPGYVAARHVQNLSAVPSCT